MVYTKEAIAYHGYDEYDGNYRVEFDWDDQDEELTVQLEDSEASGPVGYEHSITHYKIVPIGQWNQLQDHYRSLTHTAKSLIDTSYERDHWKARALDAEARIED